MNPTSNIIDPLPGVEPDSDIRSIYDDLKAGKVLTTLDAVQSCRTVSRTFKGSASEFPNILIHTWPSTNSTLTLYVLKTGNVVTKSKTIKYNVYANRRTVITGELFGGDQPFTVTVEDTWGSDNIVDI